MLEIKKYVFDVVSYLDLNLHSVTKLYASILYQYMLAQIELNFYQISGFNTFGNELFNSSALILLKVVCRTYFSIWNDTRINYNFRRKKIRWLYIVMCSEVLYIFKLCYVGTRSDLTPNRDKFRLIRHSIPLAVLANAWQP